MCLSYCSVAVMKHCGQNTYKRAYLIGVAYSIRGVSSLSPSWGAWQQAGRNGTEAVAESLHPDLQVVGRKTLGLEWALPTLSDTHLLQQGHQLGIKHLNTRAYGGILQATIMYTGALPACMFVYHIGCITYRSQKRALALSGLELQMVISHCVGCGN